VRKLLLFGLAAVLLAVVAFVTVNAADQIMPAVGQAAPGFSLPSQDGSQISLQSFRGKWVVLYFYPKDMTSGCTLEAHNFQRDLAQYEAKNAVIVGVSVDTPDSHKQFCTKEGLTFRLLADPNHTVVDAYGSLGNYAGFKIANRNTFLINPQGNIAQEWTKVDPSTHSAQVLAAIPNSVKPPNRSSVTAPKPSPNSVKPPSPNSVKPPLSNSANPPA
jgi:peroxiredoxin Q/BCP